MTEIPNQVSSMHSMSANKEVTALTNNSSVQFQVIPTTVTTSASSNNRLITRNGITNLHASQSCSINAIGGGNGNANGANSTNSLHQQQQQQQPLAVTSANGNVATATGNHIVNHVDINRSANTANSNNHNGNVIHTANNSNICLDNQMIVTSGDGHSNGNAASGGNGRNGNASRSNMTEIGHLSEQHSTSIANQRISSVTATNSMLNAPIVTSANASIVLNLSQVSLVASFFVLQNLNYNLFEDKTIFF